jgi:hypothetical protein
MLAYCLRTLMTLVLKFVHNISRLWACVPNHIIYILRATIHAFEAKKKNASLL